MSDIVLKIDPKSGISANSHSNHFKFDIKKDGEGAAEFSAFRMGDANAMAEMLEIMINTDQVFNDAFFMVASHNKPENVGIRYGDRSIKGTLEYDI